MPRIVKEGLAGEVLQEEWVVPAQEGKIESVSGAGSILSSIQDRLPVSLSNSGRPGNLAQVRGFGLTAEDIDTQAFGISLNPPQGGGFDLSIFPFFLWSGYSFRVGPSSNGYNPSAPSGSLMLKPWTFDVLRKEGAVYRAGDFYSSSGINQFFAGGKSDGQLAWLVGYSSLKTIGPSGSLSGRWQSGARYSGGIHLLATDLDSESLGPVTAWSPQARMRTTRLIPVLENAYMWGSSERLSSSAFIDLSLLQYRDPERGAQSRDQVHQWGLENSLETGNWRLGLSFRQTHFFGMGFEVPLQNFIHFKTARAMTFGSWLIEPQFQGVWIDSIGLLPQGSVGFRNEQGKNLPSSYFKLAFSQKVPSLLDRYYSYGQFIGNPNLKTEENWNVTAGLDWKAGSWEAMLQIYGQFRDHTRVLLMPDATSGLASMTNLGGSSAISIQNTLNYGFSSGWALSNSMAWTSSQIFTSGSPFPYMPAITDIFGLVYRWGVPGRKAQWSGVLRASSEYGIATHSGRILPAYCVLDTTVDLPLSSVLQLSARVENLLNQEVQWVAGYPVGRIFSIALSGQI